MSRCLLSLGSIVVVEVDIVRGPLVFGLLGVQHVVGTAQGRVDSCVLALCVDAGTRSPVPRRGVTCELVRDATP